MSFVTYHSVIDFLVGTDIYQIVVSELTYYFLFSVVKSHNVNLYLYKLPFTFDGAMIVNNFGLSTSCVNNKYLLCDFCIKSREFGRTICVSLIHFLPNIFVSHLPMEVASLSVGVCQASNVVVANFAVADRKIESPKVCVDIAVGNRNISELLIFNAKGRTWLPN